MGAMQVLCTLRWALRWGNEGKKLFTTNELAKLSERQWPWTRRKASEKLIALSGLLDNGVILTQRQQVRHRDGFHAASALRCSRLQTKSRKVFSKLEQACS
jgi:hypothetical protein